MTVHVFTNQSKSGFINNFSNEEQKIEFAEALPELLAKAKEDFSVAIIMHDNGDTMQCPDLRTLINELQKPGL